jgi:hypothetical protein
MEYFSKVRLLIGNFILTRKREKLLRKVNFSNLSNVRNIGIVWDASRIEDFACLSKFHQNMHERQIDVRIIGYYPDKILPNQYTAIRYLLCLKKSDLNLLFEPVSPDVNSFITRPFDVLIDINFRKLFPLRYISCLSVAGLKVGLRDSEPGNSPFDLMMELNRPVDTENYLNQIMFYLEMINTEQENRLTNKN